MLSVLSTIKTPEPFAGRFAALGIESVTYSHPPVFTVDEGKDFEHLISGGHTKNLFLKDKKKKLWLITALAETRINLNALSSALGAARFSFGKPELLQDTLGITPGSVTPLSLLNDTDKCVTFVLDAALLDCSAVNVHPLRNDMTTSITPDGLQSFIRDLGYDPLIVDFGGEQPVLRG